ncbi:hypothetical protein [Nocardia sp. NPDC046763]|uniref:hypothetical protein n=1 Tax=Nocardia sp. NPDC046763 TaxID=3155256 RepID=UPI0033CFADFB
MAKRSKPRKAQRTASSRPVLARELFTELNATFYQDDPSEYLLTKIEALTLMLAPDEALAPAYAAERQIGIARFGGMPVRSRITRERYVRTECILVLHHTCETLLRLYFAHTEKPDCPWLGMAASVNFAEFKDKVARALDTGFERDAVALVFLGGIDPRDAVLRVDDHQFDDGVRAFQALLAIAAETVLSESFLYNAAKHGLTIVQSEDSTRFGFSSPDGEGMPLHSGPQFAYLHKPQYPGAQGQPEWHMSMTGPLPDRDIAVSLLIQRAMASLWNVARRRYLGQSGEVFLISTTAVDDAVFGAVVEAGQHVRTYTLELPKKDNDGNFLATDHRFTAQRIPDDAVWKPGASATSPTWKRVDLPARQRDRQIVSTSKRRLLPISPTWSSRV